MRLLRLLAGETPFHHRLQQLLGRAHLPGRWASYATPFVGLFIPPDGYLALLGDFARR